MSGKEFWAFKATHGVPLDLLVDETFAAGVMPVWSEVFDAARSDGADLRKLVDHLKQLYEGKRGGDYVCIGLELLLART